MAGSTGQAEHVVGDDPATDRGLVDSVLAGDAASFRGLVDRHQTRVAAALDRLDDRYREVVVLADMEDASYEQIAVTLAIPLGTVRSRLHRGRLELRTLLVEP